MGSALLSRTRFTKGPVSPTYRFRVRMPTLARSDETASDGCGRAGSTTDDVDAAGHQLGDLGGLLGDDAHAHVLECRLGAPVLLVADEQVLLLLAPLDELVGPGSHRVLLHPLVPLLLDGLLRLHHQRAQA